MTKPFACKRVFCLFLIVLMLMPMLPAQANAATNTMVAYAYRGSQQFSPAVIGVFTDGVVVYTAPTYRDGTITVKTASGSQLTAAFVMCLGDYVSLWNVTGSIPNGDDAMLPAAAPVASDPVSIVYPDGSKVAVQPYSFSRRYQSSGTLAAMQLSKDCPASVFPAPVLDSQDNLVGIWVEADLVLCHWFQEGVFGGISDNGPIHEMRSMANYGMTESEYTNGFWGQFRYKRSLVEHCKFVGTLDGMPTDAWDVSAKKDKSVMAWMDGHTLYVGANGRIAPNKQATGLFARFGNLQDIDFGFVFDTSNVTDMHHMFYCCDNLTQLDVSSFNTSKVTTMNAMFAGLKSLKALSVSNFDTSNVTDMGMMFESCESLQQLDLSNFNTDRVTSMQVMFNQCRSLVSLDLSNFNISNVTRHDRVFDGCTKLQYLYCNDKRISSWLS